VSRAGSHVRTPRNRSQPYARVCGRSLSQRIGGWRLAVRQCVYGNCMFARPRCCGGCCVERSHWRAGGTWLGGGEVRKAAAGAAAASSAFFCSGRPSVVGALIQTGRGVRVVAFGAAALDALVLLFSEFFCSPSPRRPYPTPRPPNLASHDHGFAAAETIAAAAAIGGHRGCPRGRRAAERSTAQVSC
jgi:hypothetical protein